MITVLQEYACCDAEDKTVIQRILEIKRPKNTVVQHGCQV